MLSKGTVSVSEVKRLLRRYWWILPITAVTAGAIGFGATLVLPKKYTSSTMVLVEPPAVAEGVLPDNVYNEDLYRHLSSMKDQILSRSGLEPIITKFNVFPKDSSTEHMDDQVDALKKMVDVELIQPIPGSLSHQPPGFHISVTLNNPVVAQQVCTEITTMFFKTNSLNQEQKFKDTNAFLTSELADAKASLDEQDQKLADFKMKHLGTLPDQVQANLNMITALRTELEASTTNISRAQQDKTFNESLLAQQEANWKQMQSGGVGSTDTLDAQLAALQDQLTTLLAKYTPEHPDVLKTKAQIAEIQRRIASANADSKPNNTATVATTHEPPQIQQLRARVKQDDMSIAEAMKHQSQVQGQIASLESQVQASPMVEQQMKELTRNYQTALDHYNDLLKNQQKSAMLTDLQGQQKGEQFRVLDAPNIPTSPSFPKKGVFVGGGLAAGFALGVGVLYLIAMSDKSMYNEQDIELCLKLPVLTLVPSFDVNEYHPGVPARRGKEINLVTTKA
jgi:polysaccharide chain length determinant protein (PEP-CTERM system associated)